jgi:hypothetical protein
MAAAAMVSDTAKATKYLDTRCIMVSLPRYEASHRLSPVTDPTIKSKPIAISANKRGIVNVPDFDALPWWFHESQGKARAVTPAHLHISRCVFQP